jgi:predicted RNA binding protein YcfA (HicA-like mRNA interferase family)
VVKVRDAIKQIEADGWYLVSQRGGHRQYKHPNKAGRVTIAGLLSKDLHPKTYRSILNQAQIEDR